MQTAPRIIQLSDLKMLASIGVLDHEHQRKQMLVINVAVYLGMQDLIPKDDRVHNVLDYRILYDCVKKEIENGHTNLLESVAGRICQNLLAIPKVLGVKIKVSKPAIFPDCTVSVSTCLGEWPQ